jgi:hypothetical protein
MRDLGRHRGKHHCSLMSLTPITFDANTFSCCGGSYFATIAVFSYQLPKTSELGRAINAHITVAVYFRDLYLWFRVCSFTELSSAFIIPPPRALQLSTPTFPSSFFRVTSYEHGACPPRLYTVVYCYTPCGKSASTGSFLLQRIALHGPTLALPYTTILSKRNIDGFRLYVCS